MKETSRKDIVPLGFPLLLLQKPHQYKTEGLRTSTIPWFHHYPNWNNFGQGLVRNVNSICHLCVPVQAP